MGLSLRSPLLSPRALGAALIAALLPLGAGACRPAQQQQQYPQQQGPYYGPPQGQFQQQQQFPQQQQQFPQQPQQQFPQQQQRPQSQRPLLAPLVGVPMQQQEVRNVLGELVNALSPQQKALVQGIPLTFDPTIEVNAFAGCDESGQPFLAATTGILEAIDAISQTKATDELFGTQTYEQYCAQVLPQLVRSQNARAALPAGIIPLQFGADLRRWSRAHELFDDVVAFTFGHELAHHYLGHTGCARGQPMGAGPDPTRLGRILSNVIPLVNQAGEAASDSSGTVNALTAGRMRRPQYEWSETGGVLLLDYFARIERAAGGGGPLSLLNPVQFLKSHPNPLARIPIVQTVARNWHQQNP